MFLPKAAAACPHPRLFEPKNEKSHSKENGGKKGTVLVLLVDIGAVGEQHVHDLAHSRHGKPKRAGCGPLPSGNIGLSPNPK